MTTAYDEPPNINMTRWISDPLVFLFAGSMACAQSQPDATPAFEVASVKASASSDRPVTRSDPERFSCTHAALRFLIMRAWGVMPYNLSGPSSLDDTYYNIEAKIPPGTSKADSNLMLQRLLVERIGLVVRHEIREQTVYELMVAKGGHKLREPEPAGAGGLDDSLPSTMVGYPPVRVVRDKNGNQQLPPGKTALAHVGIGGGMVRYLGRMEAISSLVAVLEGSLHHLVIDRTGLTGTYDFTFDFVPEGLMLPSEVPGEADLPRPSILDAFERQLGLKPEPKKAPVDMLVVYSFNRVPIEN